MAYTRRDSSDFGPQVSDGCHDRYVANIVFSLCAAAASSLIAILAAAKGAPAVAIVWGALAIGFALRAWLGRRRL